MTVHSNSRCLHPRDQGSQGTNPEINVSYQSQRELIPKFALPYLGILATARVLVGVAYT